MKYMSGMTESATFSENILDVDWKFKKVNELIW